MTFCFLFPGTRLTNELSEVHGPAWQCILSDVYIITVQWFSLGDEVCMTRAVSQIHLTLLR